MKKYGAIMQIFINFPKYVIFLKNNRFFQKNLSYLSTTVPRISTWECVFDTEKARLNDEKTLNAFVRTKNEQFMTNYVGLMHRKVR